MSDAKLNPGGQSATKVKIHSILFMVGGSTLLFYCSWVQANWANNGERNYLMPFFVTIVSSPIGISGIDLARRMGKMGYSRSFRVPLFIVSLLSLPLINWEIVNFGSHILQPYESAFMYSFMPTWVGSKRFYRRSKEIPELVEIMKTASGQTQFEAECTLAQIGEPAVRAMIPYLSGSDQRMHDLAQNVIAFAGPAARTAIPALRQELARDPQRSQGIKEILRKLVPCNFAEPGSEWCR